MSHSAITRPTGGWRWGSTLWVPHLLHLPAHFVLFRKAQFQLT